MCPKLVSLLLQYKTNPDVHSASFCCLVNLTYNSNNKKQYIPLQPLAISSMKTFIEIPKVQEKASNFLYNMTFDEGNGSWLREEIPILIKSLEIHQHNYQVITEVVGLLFHLCCDSDAAKTDLIRSRVHEKMVDSIQKFFKQENLCYEC
eukprot:TRINITY_DN2947_c0_g2_i1.p1 TRINITY_DN2947_c0_g2~~TRINITY_DN2947_c0_g2_i1.p1  ORF type:complete len:149 (+),score=16.71 TRINITY_DN2947_c0_g2_i1:285-731(+)